MPADAGSMGVMTLEDAYGGNKTRKLEYLVADALAQG